MSSSERYAIFTSIHGVFASTNTLFGLILKYGENAMIYIVNNMRNAPIYPNAWDSRKWSWKYSKDPLIDLVYSENSLLFLRKNVFRAEACLLVSSSRKRYFFFFSSCIWVRNDFPHQFLRIRLMMFFRKSILFIELIYDRKDIYWTIFVFHLSETDSRRFSHAKLPTDSKMDRSSKSRKELWEVFTVFCTGNHQVCIVAIFWNNDISYAYYSEIMGSKLKKTDNFFTCHFFDSFGNALLVYSHEGKYRKKQEKGNFTLWIILLQYNQVLLAKVAYPPRWGFILKISSPERTVTQ